MDSNYFVCTLGQAALLGDKGHEYANVTSFVDVQARLIPNHPAVGFVRSGRIPKVSQRGGLHDGLDNNARESAHQVDQTWSHTVLSFGDIQRGSQAVANLFTARSSTSVAPGQTIALLCPSNASFLFIWLGMMRLGHPVLLIAPQCSPSAIASLCKTCGSTLLVYDDIYEDLARASSETAAAGEIATLQTQTLSFASDLEILDTIRQNGASGCPTKLALGTNAAPQHVAYLHHTSGTSSGVPKPIPQSHRAAVGVLPHLDGSKQATFTTTPLYHGGIADMFRAWTSDAMIWLFPGKDLPITASNVVKCLEIAKECVKSETAPPVRYFSSVPYVLQMMASDEDGLQHLQDMDIVGVGGAALPTEVGDDLVRAGVDLVSRFGSAECGFLMSSHRDYEKDKEWQFLRSGTGANPLKFEPKAEGLSELVILPGWPHLAKTNRDDGSYATADLFAPHTTISEAWRYHSRADSQLTLITGKKFDPAPLEATIATSHLLTDVLIFGNGRPYPGALLFRSSESKALSDVDLVAELAPIIERLNSDSQSHARIPRNMLVPMAFGSGDLEKSSKGTIIRGKAEQTYAKEIESAYLGTSLPSGREVPDEEAQAVILRLVESIVGKRDDLTPQTDLFSYGVDSVACVQIRYSLRHLLPSIAPELPLTIVEDCGTVEKLTQFVIGSRQGRKLDLSTAEDELELMRNLVKEYSYFESSAPRTHKQDNDLTYGEMAPKSEEHCHMRTGARSLNVSDTDREVIVLTGATGALGAHILDLYRKSEGVSKIYCLVRGASDTAAEERVNKALKQRQLGSLRDNDPTGEANKHYHAEVTVIQAQLGEPGLGLGQEVYDQIAREATIIMHIAWAVNFRLKLRSFVKDHVSGVRNLIDLALHSPRHTPPTFAFCSSVASVANYPAESTVPEQILPDPASASPLGYSRSKWIAEQICESAHKKTRLKDNIAVFRVGQLSGDTQTGIWNEKEAWPMMLSSLKVTGCLPALEDEPLTWLPVDIAAEAFVEAVTNMRIGNQDSDLGVYHIVNDDRSVTWMDLLHWLRKSEDFDVVEPTVWVRRLEASSDQDHPAMKLLAHWKKAYGEGSAFDSTQRVGAQDYMQGEGTTTSWVGERGEHTRTDKQPVRASEKRYANANTTRIAPVMQTVRPVDEAYVEKIWQWIKETV